MFCLLSRYGLHHRPGYICLASVFPKIQLQSQGGRNLWISILGLCPHCGWETLKLVTTTTTILAPRAQTHSDTVRSWFQQVTWKMTSQLPARLFAISKPFESGLLRKVGLSTCYLQQWSVATHWRLVYHIHTHTNFQPAALALNQLLHDVSSRSVKWHFLTSFRKCPRQFARDTQLQRL